MTQHGVVGRVPGGPLPHDAMNQLVPAGASRYE